MTKVEYMAAVEVSLCDWKDWLRRLVSHRIQFGFIATVRVWFISLRITCITSERSTLMWGITDTSVGDKVIDLVKISTKKNPTDMMTKNVWERSSYHLWTSSRFSNGKVENRLLGGSHVKSQKRRESKVNEAETNFYGGAKWTWVKVDIVSILSVSYIGKQSVCSDTNCCRCSESNPTRSTKATRKEEDIPNHVLNIGRVSRDIGWYLLFLPAAGMIWENCSPYRLQQKMTDIWNISR